MHTLTITTEDGRTWLSLLPSEDLAVLVEEAERIADAEGQPVNPADVAAVVLGAALAGRVWYTRRVSDRTHAGAPETP
ncbi:MAG: hypothetical protein RLZZ387_903 [Chloroflexota bacterium]